MPWIHKHGGVVCGEFLDESIRASEEGRTKTNGVAKRGERDSVRDPVWRSGKQGLEEAASHGTSVGRSEGSVSDLSGGFLP